MAFACVPQRTLSVSVTGGACALHCNHCNAHYLQHMVPVSEAQRILEAEHYPSILLSGGSDLTGRLPLVQQLPFIQWVHEQGIRINAHVGLQSDKEIRVLAPLFDKVSLDYVWDDETIHEVYHLRERSGADYLHAAYGWLDAMLVDEQAKMSRTPAASRGEAPPVLNSNTQGPEGSAERSAAEGRSAPRIKQKYSEDALTLARRRVNLHLTIGLKGGIVAGEVAAIDSLVAFEPAALIFLVLIPTAGTAYAQAPIVPIQDVESVFEHARKVLPETDLVLGCMHPRVAGYGSQLAQLAQRYGFRGVVGEKFPAHEVERVEECCVFYR